MPKGIGMALFVSVRGSARNHPWFAVCALLAICAHVFLIWSAAAQEPTILRRLYFDAAYGMGRAADFNAVYHAAVNVDRGLSPYGKGQDGITPYFQAFRYLPIVAVGAQASLRLTPLHAYWVWVAVLEVLLAWLIFVLRTQIRAPVVWALASLCLLLNSPYLLEIYMGQFTFAATASLPWRSLLPSGQFCIRWLRC
jgi:hypothetical protein